MNFEVALPCCNDSIDLICCPAIFHHAGGIAAPMHLAGRGCFFFSGLSANPFPAHTLYIYIIIYIYNPTIDFFFFGGGLTFHFMGQTFQNMGHLGSRCIYICLYIIIIYIYNIYQYLTCASKQKNMTKVRFFQFQVLKIWGKQLLQI